MVVFHRLKMPYPRGAGKYEFKLMELAQILFLSTRWRMLQIREEAIKIVEYSSFTVSPLGYFFLGRDFYIERFYKRGLIAIVKMRECMSAEDVQPMGWRDAVIISRLRESYYQEQWKEYLNRWSPAAYGANDLVSKLFPSPLAKDNGNDIDLVNALLQSLAFS
jgi:hypothetical protein